MKKTYKLDFQKIRRKTQIKDIVSFESYLKSIFSDIAKRNWSEKDGRVLEKISFIDYMSMPYIVGEKLFNVLDKKKNGFINQGEFINGIMNLYVGGLEETQKIIFELLDFDSDGNIIPEDSRLLISFIKNLSNIPNNLLKLKSRNTITDEENLNEINELINIFFCHKQVMTFVEYKHNIENVNSDVFFLFIYFFYYNKPFCESSIKMLRLMNTNPNLGSSFSSSILSTSSDDGGYETKSKIKTPSNLFKSFIVDLVELEFDEIEKHCAGESDDGDDIEDYTNLIHEDFIQITVPEFTSKLELSELKSEKDYLSQNKDNRSKLGTQIVKKSYENFIIRLSEKSNNFNLNKTYTKSLSKNFLEENSEEYNDNSKATGVLLKYNTKGSEKIKDLNNKDYKGESLFTKNVNISQTNDINFNFHSRIEIVDSKDEIIKQPNTTIPKNENKLIVKDKVGNKLNESVSINLSSDNILENSCSGIKRNNSMNISNLNIDSNRNSLFDSARSPVDDNVMADIIYENYLFKSRNNNKLKKYYVALIGMDLFYFSNSKKQKLKGMHNLSGSYIFEDENIIKVREESKKKGESHTVDYYPFKLYFKKKSRIYYCSKKEESKIWIKHIKNVTKYRDIKEHYNFAENLGKGKFGNVKLGINKLNNKKVAIKTINRSNLKGIEIEMVKTEIEIMKFCAHNNIVKLVDNFEDLEYIYIVLEYLSGGNLNNFLSQQQNILSEQKIKEILMHIGNGLKYLHHFGILHRDLKPENLMMSDKNTTAIVKIVDFGLSKILGVKEKSNDAYGTLCYAAPEVIQKYDYNNRIDLWSLGVILYFLICGYLPFNDKNNNITRIASNITKANVKLDEKIWGKFSLHAKNLLLRCLERDINKRITILEFLEDDWFKK